MRPAGREDYGICTDGRGQRHGVPADGYLFDETGKRVPGPGMCRAHFDVMAAEYAEKLGEVWTLRDLNNAVRYSSERPIGREMHHETTIDQIGRVTLGSVGARQYQRTYDSLIFTISRGHRRVTIHLAGNDTYTVTTAMIRSGRVTFQRSDVYAEDLSEAVWDAHIE